MNETLSIEKTSNSPAVLLDADKGIIELAGSSFHEDSISFYLPILDWVDKYITVPRNTIVNVDLQYFNSSSAKNLLAIFKSMRTIKKHGYELVINWSYCEDDEDIRDAGIDFAKLSGLKFNMIEKEVVSKDF